MQPRHINQSSLEEQNEYTKETSGCLPTERPRVQYLFSPWVWESQLVFNICKNPKVRSNASEEMNIPVRTRVNR